MMNDFEIKEKCPSLPKDFSYITEVLLNEKFKIPEPEPPVEKIIKIKRKIFIKKAVPVPISLCYNKVKGVKVLVSGFIQMEVTYSANLPGQEVHFLCFELPFEGVVTSRNCQYPISIHECNLKTFKLNVCVEHLEIEPVSPRKIETTVALLLWLEYKDTGCHETKCDNHPKEFPVRCLSQVSKEISTSEILAISEKKPHAKRILDNIAKIEIKKAEVISPTDTKRCHMMFRKVIIIGKALVTIKYAADCPGNQVYTANFHVPVKALIDWPGGPPEQTPIRGCVTVEFLETELLDKCHFLNLMVAKVDISKN